MKKFFIGFAMLILVPTFCIGQTVSSSTVCLPPEEPYVPDSDQALSEYAEIISKDFERYFSELTIYFKCIDGTRQAVFARARVVSEQHQRFWLRAEKLGIVEQAARGQAKPEKADVE